MAGVRAGVLAGADTDRRVHNDGVDEDRLTVARARRIGFARTEGRERVLQRESCDGRVRTSVAEGRYMNERKPAHHTTPVCQT